MLCDLLKLDPRFWPSDDFPCEGLGPGWGAPGV